MGELKSAWEIAQEKANRLGKLSAEEEEQQRKQRYRQIGQGVAQKWLDNPETLSLTTELNKHPEEEQELIKRAILSHLLQAVDLKGRSGTSPDPTSYGRSGEVKGDSRSGEVKGDNRSGGVYLRLEKILQEIASLEPESHPITEGITKLIQEYEVAGRKTRQELESKTRETLHQLRISGTAVSDINIEATPQWQQAQQHLLEALEPRLNSLKQELAKIKMTNLTSKNTQ